MTSTTKDHPSPYERGASRQVKKQSRDRTVRASPGERTGEILSVSSARKEGKFAQQVAIDTLDTMRALDLKKTNQMLKSLTKKRGNFSNKMIQTGIVLVICPDPFTSAAGAPMILVGTLLKSRSAISLQDVFKEANETVSLLRSNLSLIQ